MMMMMMIVKIKMIKMKIMMTTKIVTTATTLTITMIMAAQSLTVVLNLKTHLPQPCLIAAIQVSKGVCARPHLQYCMLLREYLPTNRKKG